MTNEEIDRKCERMEDALYQLKEREHVNPDQVTAIDNFMADVGAVALADLFDIVRALEE